MIIILDHIFLVFFLSIFFFHSKTSFIRSISLIPIYSYSCASVSAPIPNFFLSVITSYFYFLRFALFHLHQITGYDAVNECFIPNDELSYMYPLSTPKNVFDSKNEADSRRERSVAAQAQQDEAAQSVIRSVASLGL